MLEILHRRGFQKPAWFTPREFAASLPAETGMLVDQFTAAYNELRFGGKTDAASRLTLLLEELETGRTGIPVTQDRHSCLSTFLFPTRSNKSSHSPSPAPPR